MIRTGSVTIRHVAKRYGAVDALVDVSVDVMSGEVLTILGPSGSGKTSLLRILAGFERPSSGAILVDGRDVTRLAPADRGIGMVFQQYALFPHMTVRENIGYGLKVRGYPKSVAKIRVEELLRLVSLEPRAHHYPRQLSGGQQQRVALARAIAYDPDVLLMDEPLGALDRALRIEMEEEIRRIHRSTATTIIYVTHDKQEALALSDRIAIMREGRLVALDSPEELYYRPESPFVARFFSEANLAEVEVLARCGDGGARIGFRGLKLDVPGLKVEVGEPAVLTIRPRAFTLRGSDSAVRINGQLKESLLLGEERELRLDLGDGMEVVALVESRASASLTAGDRVSVFFEPSDSWLVQQDGAASPPSADPFARAATGIGVTGLSVVGAEVVDRP